MSGSIRKGLSDDIGSFCRCEQIIRIDGLEKIEKGRGKSEEC